ncbi:MAG TPA: NAD(P)H-dependent oxidoreductase [Rhizomicrobium sp.]
MSLLSPALLPSVLHFTESLARVGSENLRRLFALERVTKIRAPRKALVINGHPDPRPERYCAALTHACAEGYRAVGWDTEEIALGSMNGMDEPDDDEQARAFDKYNGAEFITLVFPLWLNAPPSLVCKFLKQASEADDAIYPARKRKFRIVVTMDMPAFAHRSPTVAPKILTPLGVPKPDEQIFIGSVGLISADLRADWLRLLRDSVIAPPVR